MPGWAELASAVYGNKIVALVLPGHGTFLNNCAVYRLAVVSEGEAGTYVTWRVAGASCVLRIMTPADILTHICLMLGEVLSPSEVSRITEDKVPGLEKFVISLG